jgi:hypothetical protein
LRRLREQGATVSFLLYTGVGLLLAIPAILVRTVRSSLRADRTRSVVRDRLFLIGFILVQIVMLMLLVNFLSSFENNRYRFPTDPLYLALLGMLLSRAASRLRGSARSSSVANHGSGS